MNRSEAMEKALKLCISEMCEHCREAGGAYVACVNECETLRIAKEALALPRRQCDVGTAEEQSQRFCSFCRPRTEPCEKIVAKCFCDLDEMEEDKPCTSDACRYYVRKKEGAGK